MDPERQRHQRLQSTSSQADGLVPMCELLIRFFWGAERSTSCTAGIEEPCEQDHSST